MSTNTYGMFDPSTMVQRKNVQSHPNPYYNYTQVFTPRRLKELFKWCEFIFYNSPHIFSVKMKQSV